MSRRFRDVPTRALHISILRPVLTASLISQSFEQVLQNINRLNRNLESVIAVGNEFSSVEALWSQFENVMGKDSEEPGDTQESHHREEGSGKKTQEQEDRDRDDEKQGR
ncbi:Dolichyl-diphosphooligosaccharide-protein glycosyltransferase subunit dad1 [Ophidiomyces ophidiicola]|nr:Dolichyl-diphosphooligosaccharide-protein glycosyltransferase subunit dad1 [Ophidiomyces ophidiicola]